MTTSDRHDREEVSRVIIDPTALFTEEALAWLEDPELRPYLVISAALWRRLEEQPPEAALLEYAEGDEELIARVRQALIENEIAKFSFEEVFDSDDLPDRARQICERILQEEEPLADVLADEWAFLTSQSLGVIVRRVRDSLKAFAQSGAEVIEIGRAEMEAALDAVQGKIPPGLLKVMKHADDRFVKLILLGGSVAAFVVPPLHLPMFIAQAARQGVAIIAGDP